MGNSKTLISRLLLIALLIIVAVAVGSLVLTPFLYRYGQIREPVWGWKCQYDFSKYTVPSNYEYLEYKDTDNNAVDPTRLVFYKNKQTDQSLVISKLREFLDVLPQEIKNDPQYFPWSNFTVTYGVGGDWDDKLHAWTVSPEFEFIYLLPPLFLDQELRHAGRELILRGISSGAPQTFETPKTAVWYVSGKFTKLGFFKKPRGIWRFPIPVFDFKRPMEGAVAVIQNKNSGKTLIAVGSAPTTKSFNEPEFRSVVESLTFDAEPVPDPIAGFPIQHSRGPLCLSIAVNSVLKVTAFCGLLLAGFWVYRRFHA